MIIEDMTDTAKTPTSNAKPDETTQKSSTRPYQIPKYSVAQQNSTRYFTRQISLVWLRWQSRAKQQKVGLKLKCSNRLFSFLRKVKSSSKKIAFLVNAKACLKLKRPQKDCPISSLRCCKSVPANHWWLEKTILLLAPRIPTSPPKLLSEWKVTRSSWTEHQKFQTCSHSSQIEALKAWTTTLRSRSQIWTA